MNGRRLLELLGVAAVVAGGAIALAPGLAVAGVDRAVVVLLGALAGLRAASEVRRRAGVEFDAAEPGEPETRDEPPSPGRRIDEELAEARSRRRTAGVRSRLRERIRRAALETLARTGYGDEEAATRALSDGRWTDDEAAATFLNDDGTTPSLPRRLAAAFGEPPFVRRARRAIVAIHERSERPAAPADGDGDGTEADDEAGEEAASGTDPRRRERRT